MFLVEDDAVVRGLVRRMLDSAGYQVLAASMGSEALRLSEAHAGKIDLLVTDVVMMEMRGDALAALLTEARPDTRVLYMSGYTEEGFVPERAGAGFEFLAKPFAAAELLARVRAVLDAC